MSLTAYYIKSNTKVIALRKQGIGYNRIGKILGVSSTTIRSTLGVLPKYDYVKYKTSQSSKPGPVKKDYTALDTELLPKVHKALKDLYNTGTERPKRVCANAIQRQLGLQEKIFEKLPICKKLILSHQETQEEFWAREVTWAVDELERQGKELCVTRIYELTNMDKRQLCSCMGEIKDRTIKKKVEVLL